MPDDIDKAADAAFARLTEPEAQPAEETFVDAATEQPDAPDPDDAGTAVEEGHAEELVEEEAPGDQPPEEAESPVEDEDEGAAPDPESSIPEDAVELPDDETFVVEINGERVALTGEELRSGYLRHDDYTRKRQAESAALKEAEAKVAEYETAAEQLDQAKAWVAERQANPPAWIAEVAAASGDPSLATAYIAQGIVHLHEAGLLTDEFASTFGLDSKDSAVRQTAEESALDTRLARIEERLQADEATKQEQQEQQELVQQFVEEYRKQWQSIVEDEGLTFETPEAEVKLRAELVEYATEREITDLEKAWLRMQRDRSKQTTAAVKDKVQANGEGGKPQPRKGQAAINRSSTPTSRAPKAPAKDIDDAADRAYQRLLAAKG